MSRRKKRQQNEAHDVRIKGEPFFVFIHVLFGKHFIIRKIVDIIIVLWLPLIVRYFGSFVCLIDSMDNTLTFWGVFITVAVYLLYFLLILSELIYNQTTAANEGKNRDITLSTLKMALQRISKLEISFFNKYVSSIFRAKREGRALDNLLAVLSYDDALCMVCDHLRDLLFDLYHLENNEQIDVALFRQNGSEWDLLTNLPGGLETDILVSCSSTAFNFIVNNPNSEVVSSKSKAISAKPKRYVPDGKDDDYMVNGKIHGTIICKPLDVKHGKSTYGRYIFTICSYGVELFANYEGKRKLMDLIVSPYEERLKKIETMRHIDLCT